MPFKDSDKYCKLCCAPLADLFVAQAHYGGKRHRKNEARRKILQELGEEAVPAELRMNGKQKLSRCCSLSVALVLSSDLLMGLL